MTSKQKSDGNEQTGRVAKEKTNPVDDDSLQSTAPGAGPPEQGNQQVSIGGSSVGEDGGAGTQQSGWSARQQAERMQARAEEDRQGAAQQSGHGGAEQHQHAGSQESPTGPSGTPQSETAAAPQDGQGDPHLPPSDSGSKRST